MGETTRQRLPLDLVTGFLGSGKTTLIGEVLRDRAFAGAMVIVNEFGEVGLDHLLVSSAQDQVVLLDSGCLCCAASDSLRDTLIDLFSRRSSGTVAAFDRIIVETSGLANPAPLVAALIGDSALTPRCELSQVLTLVDAVNGPDTLARYREAQLQVAFADRLLVTKTDLVSASQAQQVEATLATLNPRATIVRRQPGEPAAAHFEARAAVDERTRSGPASAWLRGPLRPQYADESATHGEAFANIVTHVLRIPDAIGWDGYAAWTDAMRRRFGKRLLRCKGLLAIGPDASRWIVQGVQGFFARPVPWTGASGTAGNYLVCIGEELARDELDQMLELLDPALTSQRKSS